MSAVAPFSCNYTPNVPELLIDLGCSLIVSTYQAGKVIMISALDQHQLVQLPRNFNKAMGIAVDGHKLAIATKDEVVVLAESQFLAEHYPPKPNVYDTIYAPRAVYYTGQIDLHDMHWADDKLYGVNTRFSCISRIDDSYSFRSVWRPKFITDSVPTDRCHLNGMAFDGDTLRYASAFGTTDTARGWSKGVLTDGIIMDIPSDEIIAGSLPMPHSPRIYDGQLYVLLSATGELAQVDVDKGTYTVVTRLDGFVRGMAKWGDYVFIGLSKLRKNSSVFRDLPIAQKALTCGIEIVHLPTGSSVGHIRYQSGAEELYDIQVLHGKRRPGILNHYTDMYRRVLSTPDQDFWLSDDPEKGQ